MAVYNNSIPTEAGRKLENQVRGGQGMMEFAYIEVGSGIYTEEDREQARHMDSLKEARQRFFFSSISPEEDGDGDYLLLESVIHNEGLEEGYHLTEVGIFARLAGGEETVLYCICLVDEPDYMPPQTDDKVYEIILHSTVKCYDAENVTIKYDDKTYATAGALMDHIRDKGNPHHVTKAQIGLGNVDNTADMDKPVSTAQQAAIEAVREQAGESLDGHVNDTGNPHKVTKVQVGLGSADNTPDAEKPVSAPQQAALDALYEQLAAYTRQKIADLINGAPSSLDTLKEVSDAIAAHKTIMDALDAAIGKKANAAEFDSHVKDTTKHVTAAERTGWNGKLSPTGDASDVTATFSQAATKANLTSKEKLSVSLGKIMKWFADLKTVAFSGKYTDLSDRPGVVSKTAAGFAPQLPNETATSKYLRQDGTWQAPPNTNTWRGIQNNLTSDATDQSLSAAQGKALKALIDALNTGIEKICYPYDGYTNVKLFGIISKKQTDNAGYANRYIIFVPTASNSVKPYGLKTVKTLVIQGIVVLRQNGQNMNGWQLVGTYQNRQGLFLSVAGGTDISGYLCDCTFDFS